MENTFRESMLRGALKLARAVSLTYGPCGRRVILERPGGLLSTRDGATVARDLHLADRTENLACQLLKQASLTVDSEVGDGTTTTVILAAKLLREGHKQIVGGTDLNDLLSEIKEGTALVVESLRQGSQKAAEREIHRVAEISSDGDTAIATAVAEAVLSVGKYGTVTVEDGKTLEIQVEYKDGMEIPKGFVSSDLAPEETLEGPLVAVVNRELRTFEDVSSIMEEASQWPNNPLLIIAPAISGDALATLIMNRQKKVLISTAVELPTPLYMDLLEDVAAIASATLVDPAAGMDVRAFKPEWFGFFRYATLRKESSTFISYPEAQESIQQRIATLSHQKDTTSFDYDKDRLQERIAKLSEGLCILKVGGNTETEIRERRTRVEDTLSAVRTAMESGVLPGGGLAYIQAISCLDRNMPGHRVLAEALKEPFRVLVQNSGKEPEPLLPQIEVGSNVGWDVMQGRFRDFIQEEPLLIDPTGVLVSALRSAVSTACLILSSETAVLCKSRK